MDHVLISNAVRTVSDGRWRTLDARGLYKNAKAAGVEYQTYLRAGLQASLGVEFGEVDANGQADIVGIDESVLAEFSTRSVDIEVTLADWVTGFVEREGRRPSSVEVGKAHKTITLGTRPTKPDQAGLPTATLRDGWRDRADMVVDVDRMLVSVLSNPPSPGMIVRPSVAEVLVAVETKHAEWAEPQLIEQIASRVAGPDPETIAQLIETVRAEAMASVGVIDLAPQVVSGDVLRASDGRPVEIPPSALRYTTRDHLHREIDIVAWARVPAIRHHRSVEVDYDTVVGLDASQVEAVTTMLSSPLPVVTVVGPAGAGKTRMLAAAVDNWRRADIVVFGVGPSASSAKQLADGAGTVADTLHKLVYEHSTKWTERRELPDPTWDLTVGSVVIIDEAGLVDTRLLHTYAKIAQRKHWRTVLVGDNRQLDAVDAGGMFAELIQDPDVVTVERDTLHRFEHELEAEASLRLRDRDVSVVDTYDGHGRIHGHADQTAATEAVAEAAFEGIVDGSDVLVMAPTNSVVDEINTTLTNRLLAIRWLDPLDKIEIAGNTFYPGQLVVTRANDRRLTYGPEREDWVRNGDRWTVVAGATDELYLTNRDNRQRLALPADYVADGNVTVDYASTVHRAQGATVDEAHLLLAERTDAKQLYVGATRGRAANHIHAVSPALDLEDHRLDHSTSEWSPVDAVVESLKRGADRTTALGRWRQMRELVADARRPGATEAASPAAQRLSDFRFSRTGQNLSR